MSYLVLARKYRPRTFAEVAGQEVITRTLQGAIREGRVGHAYLFTGPRGTGKTTSARVFAKALECERGPTIDPCGVCERCQAIDSGAEVDVVEIDAASNTGVDNIRDLREQAAYTPMRARFKIFIVDEVHMLSKGAFNALLKTLEEPPPHVKFLFATTELAKVPDTILSRCQVLRLSLFEEELIARRLSEILAAENVRAESGVPEALARLARGSMRDALSITDQLLALSGAAPSLEDVARLSGANAAADAARLLDAIVARDAAGALAILGPVEGEEGEWLHGLLRELRGALLVALSKDASVLPADFAADRERLAALAARIGPARLELWMEDLLVARERMESAPTLARTVFELAILALCRDEPSMPLSVLADRLAALEARLGAPSAPRPAVSAAPAMIATPAKAGTPAPAPTAAASPASARGAELRPAPPSARVTPSPALAEPAAAPAPSRPSAPSAPSTTSAPRAAVAAPAAAGGAPSRSVASDVVVPVPRVAPPSPPAPASAGVSGAAPGARGGVGLRPTWEGFLARLAAEDAPLAAVLERRGQPIEIGGGRAHVQLRGLREDERALINDPMSRARVERLFAGVLGGNANVVLEDSAQRRPGEQDPFTRSVAELFQGKIEERT